ncbi:hypothetical protein NBRC111894_1123 [Sporolactobacillus inulinus]|uniref:Uncharacterized protein n=1 Tax=Sporolactobacillus inulinus TaxID=2078 RepID=A0A4Y1Z936_9BACL|nr:hypothetical protein NBRC111894_1123 [Sporolactobacillus inulinus]
MISMEKSFSLDHCSYDLLHEKEKKTRNFYMCQAFLSTLY